MELILEKKPKNPVVIVGFPGFGLVGTITVEFLNTHLETEKIGSILSKEIGAMVAIHKGELIDAMSIYHNSKHNIVLVQGVVAPRGLEWKIAEKITELCTQLLAKEVICLEGVGSGKIKGEPRTFVIAKQDSAKKTLLLQGSQLLSEGVIIGVTAAILSSGKMNTTCIFSETASELPDSKASAQLIKSLDKYLGLDVDYKPLLHQAEQFEEKLRGIVQNSQKAQDLTDRKWLSYVG